MITIKHKLTGVILYEGELKDIPRGANLQDADLWGAILRGAYLQYANLQGANLQDADLWGAILRGAYLQYANLRGAYLLGADLQYANLQYADLQYADLQGANLRGAILRGAILRGADLQGAKLPDFLIVPSEGSFICWKKTTKGVVKLLVPADAKRTNSLTSRKCRASKVTVLEGDGLGGTGPYYSDFKYKAGVTLEVPDFDDDIRVDCTRGIHFFMTEQEAREFV